MNIMNKFFFVAAAFAPMFASAADYGMRIQMLDSEITKLVAEKQQKYAELKQCEANAEGFKIAGISLIGLTAVGIGVNIYQASRINRRADTIENLAGDISDVDNRIAAEQMKSETDAIDNESAIIEKYLAAQAATNTTPVESGTETVIENIDDGTVTAVVKTTETAAPDVAVTPKAATIITEKPAAVTENSVALPIVPAVVTPAAPEPIVVTTAENPAPKLSMPPVEYTQAQKPVSAVTHSVASASITVQSVTPPSIPMAELMASRNKPVEKTPEQLRAEILEGQLEIQQSILERKDYELAQKQEERRIAKSQADAAKAKEKAAEQEARRMEAERRKAESDLAAAEIKKGLESAVEQLKAVRDEVAAQTDLASDNLDAARAERIAADAAEKDADASLNTAQAERRQAERDARESKRELENARRIFDNGLN